MPGPKERSVSDQEFADIISAIKFIASIDRSKANFNDSIRNTLAYSNRGWENGGPFISAIGLAIRQMKSRFATSIPIEVLKKAVENYPAIKKAEGIEGMLREDTTTANVAPYPVPLGSMLRSKKKVKISDVVEWAAKFARKALTEDDLRQK